MLNNLDDGRHHFETADCFELLEQYAASGERFDLVILDPPSFARRKESRFAAQRAYARLNALGMRCVVPGGLLATASCTTQVGDRRRSAKRWQQPALSPTDGCRSFTRLVNRSIIQRQRTFPKEGI